MTIAFTIHGNQENAEGNPIPKIKMTQAQGWTPLAQRYADWKKYVQEKAQPALIAAAIDMPKVPDHKLMQGERFMKPITIEAGLHMHTKIVWANERHADPENVFGSIADALFLNDKHLDGSFESAHSPNGKGRVEVTIEIKEHALTLPG